MSKSEEKTRKPATKKKVGKIWQKMNPEPWWNPVCWARPRSQRRANRRVQGTPHGFAAISKYIDRVSGLGLAIGPIVNFGVP